MCPTLYRLQISLASAVYVVCSGITLPESAAGCVIIILCYSFYHNRMVCVS